MSARAGRECRWCGGALAKQQKTFCSRACHTRCLEENPMWRKLDSAQVYDYSDYDPEDELYDRV